MNLRWSQSVQCSQIANNPQSFSKIHKSGNKFRYVVALVVVTLYKNMYNLEARLKKKFCTLPLPLGASAVVKSLNQIFGSLQINFMRLLQELYMTCTKNVIFVEKDLASYTTKFLNCCHIIRLLEQLHRYELYKTMIVQVRKHNKSFPKLGHLF